MTAQKNTTTSNFMADFAASDRRSAKAHIQGTSFRAKTFSAFMSASKLVGRGDRAAADYKAASRFVFKRNDAIRSCGKKVGRALTAAIGLTAGITLYIVLVL